MDPVLETSLKTAIPPSEIGTCLTLAILHPASLQPDQQLATLPLTIGRAPSCDLTLEDSSVSREHARIERDQGKLWLADLGSKNGTQRNRLPVRAGRAELQVGDVLRLGDVVLRLVSRPLDFQAGIAADELLAPAVLELLPRLAAVDLLEESTELVDRLWENTRFFKAEMKRLGFDTAHSVTPITPIMLGESKLAQDFATEIFNEGVFALPIVYPMVAQGKARIRLMVTAAHTKEDLNDALAIFEKVGKKLAVLK